MAEPMTPGSPAALKAGCTCGSLRNGGGRGFRLRGETLFWLDEKCPVHKGQTEWKNGGKEPK